MYSSISLTSCLASCFCGPGVDISRFLRREPGVGGAGEHPDRGLHVHRGRCGEARAHHALLLHRAHLHHRVSAAATHALCEADVCLLTCVLFLSISLTSYQLLYIILALLLYLLPLGNMNPSPTQTQYSIPPVLVPYCHFSFVLFTTLLLILFLLVIFGISYRAYKHNGIQCMNDNAWTDVPILFSL